MKHVTFKVDDLFTDCVEKKLGGNATATPQQKLDGGVRNWSFDDFDAMEIRRNSSTNFDDAGV